MCACTHTSMQAGLCAGSPTLGVALTPKKLNGMSSSGSLPRTDDSAAGSIMGTVIHVAYLASPGPPSSARHWFTTVHPCRSDGCTDKMHACLRGFVQDGPSLSRRWIHGHDACLFAILANLQRAISSQYHVPGAKPAKRKIASSQRLARVGERRVLLALDDRYLCELIRRRLRGGLPVPRIPISDRRRVSALSSITTARAASTAGHLHCRT